MMIDQWTMAQAKRDFMIGYLESYEIERAFIGQGWVVRFKGGTNRGPLVDARSHEARIFKTLDAAVVAIEQVGFRVDALFKDR
jgi:hypothetical protein